jgi:alkane 1-monooxygenase
MEKSGNWAARILLFLPFTLPLVFARKVPILHFAHPRWVFVAILYAYALPPLLDLIGGNNRTNPHPGRQSWTSKALEYVFLPRVLFFKVLLLKFLMLSIVATGRFDVFDVLGIAYLTGQSISSYGIFIAHELLHRKSKIDKVMAEIMMVSVIYPHFCIEHLYGHHRYAATAEDPATSRYGETLYAFLPRSIFGGMFHAWQWEIARLKRRGYGWFSYRNQMLRYAAEVVGLLGGVYYFFGILGLAAFVVQAIVAVVTLEVINYVQHYGLERKRIGPGLYENTTVAHSWNSECWFSNAYWLNLGRHSDHHYVANRGFEMLRSFEDEPELPAGFPAMFLLAFIPPLWFRVMNPRVDALKQARRAQPDSVDVRRRMNLAPASQSSRAGAGPFPPVPGWRSCIIDGSGLLMAASVVLLIAVDIVVGYPNGLIMIGVICLALVVARHTFTHRHFNEVRP